MFLLTTGEIIKKMRIEKGYTQTELAVMLGLKLSTMQKYESGAICNLKIDTIRELCHIFDVPPWLFIFPENVYVPIHDNIILTEIFNGEMYHDFLKLYVSLNAAGRKRANDYMIDLKKIPQYNNEILNKGVWE